MKKIFANIALILMCAFIFAGCFENKVLQMQYKSNFAFVDATLQLTFGLGDKPGKTLKINLVKTKFNHYILTTFCFLVILLIFVDIKNNITY